MAKLPNLDDQMASMQWLMDAMTTGTIPMDDPIRLKVALLAIDAQTATARLAPKHACTRTYTTKLINGAEVWAELQKFTRWTGFGTMLFCSLSEEMRCVSTIYGLNLMLRGAPSARITPGRDRHQRPVFLSEVGYRLDGKNKGTQQNSLSA